MRHDSTTIRLGEELVYLCALQRDYPTHRKARSWKSKETRLRKILAARE
jgi:hypothetical protein